MKTSHVISLFEHQSIPYARLPALPVDPAARERLLEQIERINLAAGMEILHLGRKALHANALVGVLRAGDLTFEILPKIDWEPGRQPEDSPSTPTPRDSALQNLLVLLSYATHIPLYAQATAGMETHTSPWFELLTRLFAADLAPQVRAGLSLQYIAQEDSLPALRGRWNIRRQITRPAQAHQRFDVLYDVLSADIALNRILYFVTARLAGLSQDAENLALLREITAGFRSVTLLPEVAPALLDEVHFNRLNNRFQPAFQFARLFLSGKSIQLSAGRVPAYAFVFDMNGLFERFVSAFIQRHREAVLPPDWQSAEVIEQAAGRHWFLARSAGRRAFRLRPDLILQRRKDPAPLLVADMKYKRLDPTTLQSGASQADIYQMLAYAVRSGCPRGLLLYPQAAGSAPIRREFIIDRAGLRLVTATLNLRAPLLPPDTLINELREILAIAEEIIPKKD